MNICVLAELEDGTKLDCMTEWCLIKDCHGGTAQVCHFPCHLEPHQKLHVSKAKIESIVQIKRLRIILEKGCGPDKRFGVYQINVTPAAGQPTGSKVSGKVRTRRVVRSNAKKNRGINKGTTAAETKVPLASDCVIGDDDVTMSDARSSNDAADALADDARSSNDAADTLSSNDVADTLSSNDDAESSDEEDSESSFGFDFQMLDNVLNDLPPLDIDVDAQESSTFLQGLSEIDANDAVTMEGLQLCELADNCIPATLTNETNLPLENIF